MPAADDYAPVDVMTVGPDPRPRHRDMSDAELIDTALGRYRWHLEEAVMDPRLCHPDDRPILERRMDRIDALLRRSKS